MVQVVVIDFGFFRAVAIYQRQGFEAVWLIQIGAVLNPGFFGNESVALPQEFGSGQTVGFGDTSAEGVVFVVAVAVHGEAVATYIGGVSTGHALVLFQQVAGAWFAIS